MKNEKVKISDKIRNFAFFILNCLLPQRCISCGKIGEMICDNCLFRLPGEANVYGITTLFPYSDPTVRKAIWLLKYKGVTGIVRPLARAVHERLIEDLSSLTELTLTTGEKIVIIPAPLSEERQKERGFNQSELLAREIMNIDGGRSFEVRADVLKKIRNTPSQVSIKNKTERIENLKGVFTLEDRNAVKNRIVVLLDDVTTTGTTLTECAHILRRAKPRRIIKIALAH